MRTPLALAAAVAYLAHVAAQDFPACSVTVTAPAATPCYNDSGTRPVSFLASTTLPRMSVESCATLCWAYGYLYVAATGHGGATPAAFCYCGDALNPAATRVSSSLCNVTCPGNAAQSCGGDGYTALYTSTCDAPLPGPQPVGPPLPAGRSCSQAAAQRWPFCNASLPLEERLDDLVNRVALPEIGAQLTSRESPAIPRLGTRPFYWGTNAIHGIAGDYCQGSLCPTTWPDAVAMAASFNASAWRLMGAVTGRELRALDNTVWSHADSPNGGLTSWGPTCNLLRDTRWGRSQESVSEDPLVAGKYCAAVSAGLQQGDDPRYLLGVATQKHLAAYSLEDYGPNNNHEWMRQTFNAVVTAFDLGDSYLPVFERAIREGGAAGIMYAANELNGVPCAASTYLDGLLTTWGFDGYRCTDGGQIINMVDGHKYARTLDEAIGFAARAESDIADGPEYRDNLVEAVVNRNTTLALARRLLRNAMRVRMRTGEFDPPEGQRYLNFSVARDLNDAEARAGSALASRQSLVLLKNSGGALPLKRGTSLAVIGPNANSTAVLAGNYAGAWCGLGPHGPRTDCTPSIYTAITGTYAPDAVYVLGSGIATEVPGGVDAAVAAAGAADATVLVLGLDQTQEGEQHDRYNISLPPPQTALYSAVAAALAGSAKPLVVVLVHGGMLAVADIAAGATAIIDALYPGAAGGGLAVADALFGAFSPSGKMPYTTYQLAYQGDYNFTHMDIAGDVGSGGTGGRTYRYFTGVPLWPAFYGLSYCNFSLAFGSPPPPPVVTLSVSAPAPFNFTVRVANAGPMDAEETLFAFFAPRIASLAPPTPPFVPLRQLFAFEKRSIAAGGVADVALQVGPVDLLLTLAGGVKGSVLGEYDVRISRGHGEELAFAVTLVQ